MQSQNSSSKKIEGSKIISNNIHFKKIRGIDDPVILFMKYSVPCAQVLVTLKRITESDLNIIEEKTRNEIPIEKAELERLFTAAFRRIKDLAKKMNKDPWSIEVIREYFSEGKHNDYISDGEGMYKYVDEGFKERCKVNRGVINNMKKVKDKIILHVNYGKNKSREVFADFIKNPKIGEKVLIHHFYACEKV